MTAIYRTLTLISLALLSATALAHSGSIGSSHFHNTFFEGLTHPVTGTDHLIALLLAGALLAQGSLRTVTGSITVLLVALLSGTGLGVLFGASVVVEYLILGSCVVLAVWLWKSKKLPVSQLQRLAVLSVVIMVHGWAHGAELPAANVIPFIAGFELAAALLMLTGLCGTRILQRLKKQRHAHTA